MGYYSDASGVFHGFLRSRDGTISTFDVSGAGTGPGQGTFPENINGGGAITGQYVDASGVNHGFLRTRDGDITTFDVSAAGTSSGQGTIPTSNNPANAITGFYFDANGAPDGGGGGVAPKRFASQERCLRVSCPDECIIPAHHQNAIAE